RRIPVIADTYVDKEFGTGCVKITPAHDFNDYDVGKRNNLPMIAVLDDHANVRDVAGLYTPTGESLPEIDGFDGTLPADFQGLERFAARKKIIADFDALGLLDKTEAHTNKVPY